MKLTKNFTEIEFIWFDFFGDYQKRVISEYLNNRQKYVSSLTELSQNLQVLRDYYCESVVITAGFRPKFWEILQGRSGNSKHIECIAADFKIKGVKPKDISETIEKLIVDGKMKEGGIGVYSSWVHYDIRGTKARW